MRALAAVVALLLAACAGVGLSKQPSVTLAGLDVDSIGLFEQRFILKLRVKNPNDVDIPVQGLNFSVDLNGQHFADGVSNQAVTIPRQGEAVLDVKATSNLGDFLRQGSLLDRDGRLAAEYRIKGTLRVSGYGEIPFDRRGDVPFPKLPGFDGKAPPRPPSRPLPGAV